jgi:hypothetical protein
MQFSLNAFDPTAKKTTFKVVVIKGTLKKIFFRDAFSESELRLQFPDAKEIKRLGLNPPIQ